jgi:hypothetical protein
MTASVRRFVDIGQVLIAPSDPPGIFGQHADRTRPIN